MNKDIRGIIDSATPGPWEIRQYNAETGRPQIVHAVGEVKYSIAEVFIGRFKLANEEFISTFDPEHISLMEDTIEASKWLAATSEYQDEAIQRYEDALDALEIYRGRKTPDEIILSLAKCHSMSEVDKV